MSDIDDIDDSDLIVDQKLTNIQENKKITNALVKKNSQSKQPLRKKIPEPKIEKIKEEVLKEEVLKEDLEDNIDVDLGDVNLEDITELIKNVTEDQKAKKETRKEEDKIAQELREKYKNLGKDTDMEDITKRKESRRELSERLEKDPEFRQEYIDEQKDKRREESQKIIDRLRNKNSYTTSEYSDDDIPDDIYTATEPLPDEPGITKNGVYINRVDKLVIKITL
jgi:hypothetical protein